MIGGRDVVGQAQTGSGRTGAYGIPLVERLDPAKRTLQGLVLVPTRELALQVAGDVRALARGRGLAGERRLARGGRAFCPGCSGRAAVFHHDQLLRPG